MLFTELTPNDRPAAARAAGFTAVESWWPFPTATPSAEDVTAFVSAIDAADVRLVQLNFSGGNDGGLMSRPGCQDEFQAGVHTAMGIAQRLGCRKFNAPFGHRAPDVDRVEEDTVAMANLAVAAEIAGELGGTVLLEPVSGVPGYPLTTAAHALTVIDEIEVHTGLTNIGLLTDLYHLAVNGDDVDRVITDHIGRIAHVQIADAPGRHEPGTGSLDLRRWLNTLAGNGYPGYVAAEYIPAGRTVDGLDWLADYAATIREVSIPPTITPSST